MMKERVKSFYEKYGRWIPIASFILGFLFDACMLRRIDELKVILQQALYLTLSAALIAIELIETTREIREPRWLKRVWKYREAVLHFMLGTLLNSYTIFYFKSTSTLSSFGFIALLVALLMLNEFKHFGEYQPRIHVAFFGLCLTSYLVSLVPILLGFIGMLPFLLSIGASILIFSLYIAILKPRFLDKPRLIRTHLLGPFLGIQTLFVLLYFAGAIPPVPLSITYMGIYHQVARRHGHYELTYTRPFWKFWQNGDQTFLARPGDTIYCFTQIFSPTHFRDQIKVRWLYHDPKLGWLPSDAIPMTVVGGRDQGYRGVTEKKNYHPGDWRVQIETADEREIGRIGFHVVADTDSDPRVLYTENR